MDIPSLIAFILFIVPILVGFFIIIMAILEDVWCCSNKKQVWQTFKMKVGIIRPKYKKGQHLLTLSGRKFVANKIEVNYRQFLYRGDIYKDDNSYLASACECDLKPYFPNWKRRLN